MTLMYVLFSVLLILFLFYFFSSLKKEDKLIYILSSGGLLGIYMTASVFADLTTAFIPIIVFLIVGLAYYFKVKSKNIIRDANKVKAKQDTYWGIDPDRVRERFAHRIVKKRGRYEIDDKYLTVDFFYKMDRKGKKTLTTKTINEISNYKPDKVLTKISSIDYFKKDASELAVKVYNMCVNFAEEAEIEFDYEEVLRKNNYYLEWFLLYIWERTAVNENIGVATLNVVAENKKEEHLIGALDSAISFCANKDGLEMIMHYYFYHGRFSQGVSK